MNRILHTTLVLFGMIGVVLFPAIAAAQQSSTETVTVQVSGKTPAGTSVIGTIVINRSCGASVQSDVAFNGMINGAQATFSGQVIERWLGNGKEEIEVVSTNLSGLVLGGSPLRTIMLVQTGANTITVDGVPAAIDGTLAPPCSGRASYTVTNAGQGAQSIKQLPNTSSRAGLEGARQLLFQPYVIAGLFVGAGALLIVAGLLLRDRSQRRAGVAVAQEQ